MKAGQFGDSRRGQETWERRLAKKIEVGRGIKAKDAKGRLKPTCPKVQLAIRKPVPFFTEEQPNTFSEE